MEKSKLYTRSGDKGMTSLAGGKKVPKTDLRLEAYGTVDELNSHLGLLIAMIPDEKGADIRKFLINVQHNLLNLGTRLATPRDYWPKIAAHYSLPQDTIIGLEQAIDRMEEKLPSARWGTSRSSSPGMPHRMPARGAADTDTKFRRSPRTRNLGLHK